ncbi:MAG: L-glutamate gamma-semialdehyde dehydrogenase [Treponema sp.]|nr:L-glutamate gamma-semialdehyde dehydrogenase [Treponema sp.]
MNDAILRTPPAENEPVLSYAPGSPERTLLKAEIDRLLAQDFDIPCIIGGREVRTGVTSPIVRPDDLSRPLGRFHRAGEAEAGIAVDAALKAKAEWEDMGWEERAAVFRRAAALIAGKYRPAIVASTMLNQSKTVHQAEIDAACEVVDFLRINPRFMESLYSQQPQSGRDEWNRVQYRPLEGFVYAVTPFNFTSIAANLPTAPAMMGNVVVWKPASTSVLSNWFLMKIFEEAGLPPGVINFLPGNGGTISKVALARPEFAGLHFTGSTNVFNSLWRQVADNLSIYRSYPRVVGETGGKDFIFLDPSADREVALVAALRGAFEYQGQKCSAASRLYVPSGLAPEFLDNLGAEIESIKMGPTTDFRNFMGAVIDETSFGTIMPYLGRACSASSASCGLKLLAGGTGDKSAGYFIRPTLLLAEDPRYETMEKELFGPVLSAYVYDEGDLEAAYRLVDTTSPYGLTGAVIANDRGAVVRALHALRHAAGNLYVNDKPTGAVVGRQPFGGMRASGTNDKAGSILNLIRWTSAGAVKENFDPPRSWGYPFMDEE